MSNNFDLYDFLLTMSALVICITIHEFAHAYSAWRAGDETPRLQKRLSLNPIDHLDPIGTLMMVLSSFSGFGIGWGKPVQTNPANYHHPRWDNLRVALWGPLSNILTAVVTGIALRYIFKSGMHSEFVGNLAGFLTMVTAISLGLAFFNLIPIAPLDGSHILSSLLPYEQARRYDIFMMRYGMTLFLGIIFLSPMLFGHSMLSYIIGPPQRLLFGLLTGIHY